MIEEKTIEVDFPLKGFLPKQLKVFNLCKKGFITMYSGAFRAGKTKLLAHVGIATALENAGCRGLVGALTETRLGTVVFRQFKDEIKLYQQRIDEAGIDLQLAKRIIESKGERLIEFYNGSIIDFRACNEERNLSGYTIDFFLLDEPVDMVQDVFTQFIGRLSGTGTVKKPFAMLATNPESELHWLYKYFFLNDDENFKCIETNTYENKLLPHYDEYIQRCLKNWDSDWVKRYLDGKWGAFSGAIYKEFNPDKHMGSFRKIPVEYMIAGVDWGLRDPYVILIGGVTSDNRLIIKYEYYGKGITTKELAEKLAKLHEEHKFRKVYCDPSAADLILQAYNQGVPIGKKVGSEIRSFADRDIFSGIARVQSLFKNDSLLVDTSCINFRKEHSSYRYSEGKDKPMKGQKDHTCDATRYLTSDFNPYSDDNYFENVFWDNKNRWT
jgi:PBSX family phage terminase large subunit